MKLDPALITAITAVIVAGIGWASNKRGQQQSARSDDAAATIAKREQGWTEMRDLNDHVIAELERVRNAREQERAEFRTAFQDLTSTLRAVLSSVRDDAQRRKATAHVEQVEDRWLDDQPLD